MKKTNDTFSESFRNSPAVLRKLKKFGVYVMPCPKLCILSFRISGYDTAGLLRFWQYGKREEERKGFCQDSEIKVKPFLCGSHNITS